MSEQTEKAVRAWCGEKPDREKLDLEIMELGDGRVIVRCPNCDVEAAGITVGAALENFEALHEECA